MKNLIFLLLLLPYGVFAQIREEYLQELPQNANIYPIQCTDYNYYFGEYPYTLQNDSITKRPIIVRNEKYLAEQDVNVIEEQPAGYYPVTHLSKGISFIHYNHEYPPVKISLDSLRDGIYIYYYDRVYYEDGDTLKFSDRCVRGVFEIKNNLLDGEVKLYYPNKLLQASYQYTNGRRNGSFHFQSFDFKNPTVVSSLIEYNEIVTGNYVNDRLDGVYTLFAAYFAGKNLIKESTHYSLENGKKHGSYLETVNDSPLVAGQYKNGKAVGAWSYNNWKIQGSKIILTPKLSFTVAKNPVVCQELFFHFGGDNDLLKQRNSWSIAPLGYFNEETFQIDPHYLTSDNYAATRTETYYNLFYCLPDSSDLVSTRLKYSTWEYSQRYNRSNKISAHELEDTCGVFFLFDEVSIYHPNGQLCVHYDFTKPADLHKTIFYHSNGKVKIRNTIGKSRKHIEQSVFDANGRLETKTLHNLNGEQLQILFPAQTFTRNGKSYRKSGNEWELQTKTLLNQQSSEKYLINETLNEQLQVIYEHSYIPADKKGVIVRTLDKKSGALDSIYYRFAENYTGLTYHHVLRVGKLQFAHDSTVIFGKDDLVQFGIPKSEKDTLKTCLFGLYGYFDLSHNLTHNSKAYSGEVTFDIREQGKTIVEQNAKQTHISINRNEQYKWESFIQQFSGDQTRLDLAQKTAASYFDTYVSEEDSIQLETYSVQKIWHKFESGSVHQVEITAKNGLPLQSVDYQKKVARTYNNYGSYQLPFLQDGDTLVSFLSKEYVFNPELLLSTDFNILGDTTYFTKKNTNSREVYTKSIYFDSKEEYTSLNDTLVRYKRFTASTNELTSSYDATLKKVEIWDQYPFHHVEIYLDKNSIEKEIRYYDENDHLKKKQLFSNGTAQEEIYLEGSLQTTIQYDSIRYWKYMSRPRELSISRLNEIIRVPLNNLVQNESSLITRYDIYGKITEQGKFVDSYKSGIWKYHYPQTLGKFVVSYEDTVVKSDTFCKVMMLDFEVFGNDAADIPAKKATISFYDENSNLKSKGILYEFGSEYSCTHNDYTEQYIIEYSLYKGKPTEGTSYNIVNYYPNGNKMNEGVIVNGKPDGLWKWYHSDGLLYEVGKYQQGIREGRWLKGDLSKVRFTGEMCLDTESEDFKAISRQIEVEITYYKDGKIEYSEIHQLETE